MSTHDASQHSSTSNRSVLDPSGPPCLLALEDGKCFTGMLFGAPGTVKGELVFNTSLIGYQEILTDPSYAGQVVTLTYPEIGNYGTNNEDIESTGGGVHARGLVIRHLSRQFSSWRGEGHLTEFMVKHNVIGISGVDTRAVTRHIRDKGAMRCAISSEILDPKELIKVAVGEAAMEGADFTGEVTTDKIYKIGSGKNQVAVMDFGIKKNILNQLSRGDNTLTVYPADTKADVILANRPAALFLSNGPGDPAACKDIIVELAKLIEARLPIFGICLGHQLLAIALGASTYKLKFGHRGGNQPVKDLVTGKIEITCQNHGFAVDVQSLPATMELTHINLNDQSVEGFRHKELPIFGIQYHPESSPGPHDSNYLFDRFFEMIESQRKVSV
ncbi:MAG TPA: glutamine-hydrolyzing carbamoyl-phosphate synthase small subunit [Oculatellaceae cyanobacterium]